MNCREVQGLFVTYLDREVGPSEQTLIEAHLADCQACDRELSALRGTRARLTASLQAQAAQASPSPQALDRLTAGLAEDANAPPRGVAATGRSFRNMPTRWKVATTLAAVVALAAATGASVPDARAGAGEVFSGFMVIIVGSAPAEGGGGAALPPDLAALPAGSEALVLQPTYLPAAFAEQGGSTFGSGSLGADEGAVPETQNVYQSGGDIIVITTTAADDARLPDGTAIKVNGHPAVLATGISGTVETPPSPPVPPAGPAGGGECGVSFGTHTEALGTQSGPSTQVGGDPGGGGAVAGGGVSVPGGGAAVPGGGVVQQPYGEPPDTSPIKYTDANRITWDEGEVRIEVLSTLPVAEVLKVAEGFTVTL